jgi:hypothetical protein
MLLSSQDSQHSEYPGHSCDQTANERLSCGYDNFVSGVGHKTGQFTFSSFLVEKGLQAKRGLSIAIVQGMVGAKDVHFLS